MAKVEARIIRAVRHYVALTDEEKQFLIGHNRPDLVRMANHDEVDQAQANQTLIDIKKVFTDYGFNQGSA